MKRTFTWFDNCIDKWRNTTEEYKTFSRLQET